MGVVMSYYVRSSRKAGDSGSPMSSMTTNSLGGERGGVVPSAGLKARKALVETPN